MKLARVTRVTNDDRDDVIKYMSLAGRQDERKGYIIPWLKLRILMSFSLDMGHEKNNLEKLFNNENQRVCLMM